MTDRLKWRHGLAIAAVSLSVAACGGSLADPGNGAGADPAQRVAEPESGNTKAAEKPESTADLSGVPVADAREAYYFSELSRMVATADAVVMGEVVDTHEGASVTGGFRIRGVSIDVNEVLHGDIGDVSRLMVGEEGWAPDGKPYRVNGYQWSQVGDESIFFLDAYEGEAGTTEFMVLNSQSRFVVEQDGKVRPAIDEHHRSRDGVSRDVDGMDRTSVVERIRDAAERASRGEVRPAPRLPERQ